MESKLSLVERKDENKRTKPGVLNLSEHGKK
jgi:hypothetical protein